MIARRPSRSARPRGEVAVNARSTRRRRSPPRGHRPRRAGSRVGGLSAPAQRRAAPRRARDGWRARRDDGSLRVRARCAPPRQLQTTPRLRARGPRLLRHVARGRRSPALCMDEHRHRYGRTQSDRPDGAKRSGRLDASWQTSSATSWDSRRSRATPTRPDVELERAERRAVLDGALAQLDVTDRLILRLRFEDALSVPEIARLVGVDSPFKIYRQLDKVLATVRKAARSRGNPRCAADRAVGSARASRAAHIRAVVWNETRSTTRDRSERAPDRSQRTRASVRRRACGLPGPRPVARTSGGASRRTSTSARRAGASSWHCRGSRTPIPAASDRARASSTLVDAGRGGRRDRRAPPAAPNESRARAGRRPRGRDASPRPTADRASRSCLRPTACTVPAPRHFTWRSANADVYRIYVLTESGDPVWTTETTDTTIALPDSVSLQSGPRVLLASRRDRQRHRGDDRRPSTADPTRMTVDRRRDLAHRAARRAVSTAERAPRHPHGLRRRGRATVRPARHAAARFPARGRRVALRARQVRQCARDLARVARAGSRARATRTWKRAPSRPSASPPIGWATSTKHARRAEQSLAVARSGAPTRTVAKAYNVLGLAHEGRRPIRRGDRVSSRRRSRSHARRTTATSSRVRRATSGSPQ